MSPKAKRSCQKQKIFTSKKFQLEGCGFKKKLYRDEKNLE